MCNLYTQTRSVDEIARLFRDLQMRLLFPEGAPNLQPRDVCITDPAPIVRRAQGGGDPAYDLLLRRWSWPAPNGKPVYNFRSDGREFPADRCLILADGFYEFTAPEDPKVKRKDRWLFTAPDAGPLGIGGLLGIAGITRAVEGTGEAFTMLTTEPGADVAPYHNRQVALLPQADWAAWLSGEVPARDLIGPLPPGSLTVRPAPR